MASKKLTSIKMSAAWELERSAPNIVLRVCRMTLTSLDIYNEGETEISTVSSWASSIFIALKMRGHSKRVLRSPEIDLSASSYSDENGRRVDLYLDLSYQYGHVIKGDDNILYIMLQRRKKYKSKPMLGYKTLAVCEVNMAQVLQRRFEEHSVELISTGKTHRPIARVFIRSLSSLPTEAAIVPNYGRSSTSALGGPISPNSRDTAKKVGSSTTDDGIDESIDFGDIEADWDRAEDSDLGEEICPGEEGRSRQQKKFLRAIGVQKNLKRKFIGLIRKFKMSEDDECLEEEAADDGMEDGEFERIMEEIERLGSASDVDSDLEGDDLSLQSTPRPRLRPFFVQRMPSGSDDTQLVKGSPNVADARQMLANAPASVEQDSSEENSNDSGGGGTDGMGGGTNTSSGGPGNTGTASTGGRRRIGGSKLPRMKRLTSTGKLRESQTTGPGGVVLREKRSATNVGIGVGGGPGPLNSAAPGGGPAMTQQQQQPAQQQRKSRYSVALAASELASIDRKRSSSIPDWRQTAANSGPAQLVQYQALVRAEPSAEVMESVSRWILAEPSVVHNTYVLVQKGYQSSKGVIDAFSQLATPAIPIANYADMKYAMTHIMNKLQNQNRSAGHIRLGALGGDSLLNLLLRCIVEQLSSRSPDWLALLRIFPVPMPPSLNLPNSPQSPPPQQQPSMSPTGANPGGQVPYVTCRALAMLDERYAALFGEAGRWRADQCEPAEMARRMATYMNEASRVLQLPVSECLMVTRSKTTGDEEASEQYIPFLGGIQLGDVDRLPASWFSFSAEAEEMAPASNTPDRPTPPSSPHPSAGQMRLNTTSSSSTAAIAIGGAQSSGISGVIATGSAGVSGDRTAVGLSPRDTTVVVGSAPAGSTAVPTAATEAQLVNGSATSPPAGPVPFLPSESVDILIDYWLDGSDRKCSIKKSSTRCVQISNNYLLTNTSEGTNQLLTMTVASMEKKQKIMRIGKKQKEFEIRRDLIENISRLVATSKGQSNSMKVIIDGIAWPSVKFFQLSPSWHTHVKWFPIAVFQEPVRPHPSAASS